MEPTKLVNWKTIRELPTKKDMAVVLGWGELPDFELVFYDHLSKRWRDINGNHTEISHWQQLPKPPKI